MRVGIVTGSLSRHAGGLFGAVRRLSQELARLPDVDVAVFGVADREASTDLAAWAPVVARAFPAWGPPGWSYAPALGRAVRAWAPDVVQVHGIWNATSLQHCLARRGRSWPYIVNPHGMLDPWAVAKSSHKKRLASLVYEGAHLRGASCLRALCEAEALAIRAYGLRNPVCVIPNGVDQPSRNGVGAPAWAARVPQEARVLLYLGRIHPKKGLATLLHAWAQRRCEDAAGAARWRLVIAGWDQDGHERELTGLAGALGLADVVIFAGPQFDRSQAESYARAEAFVLPSVSEGLPMAVLEAWSHELPVLMTPQCNLPEGFAAGAAIRAEPESASLAEGLAALWVMGDQERQAMGRKGHELVETCFAWPPVAAAMRDVCAWVTGGGTPPGCVLTD